MKIIYLFSILLLVACGGGGSSSPNSDALSTPAITGLQGDINAIEPVDLD